MEFDPSKQTWEEFVGESGRRAAAEMDAAGRREARELFAESPEQAARLLRQWEEFLPAMGKGMDREKIAAAVDEFRKLQTGTV